MDGILTLAGWTVKNEEEARLQAQPDWADTFSGVSPKSTDPSHEMDH
jgi:hypothetical protein